MEAWTLLNHLEQQLLLLQKQKHQFLNVEHLSPENLQALAAGLKDIIPQTQSIPSSHRSTQPAARKSPGSPGGSASSGPGIQNLRSLLDKNRAAPSARPTPQVPSTPTPTSVPQNRNVVGTAQRPPVSPDATGNDPLSECHTLEALQQKFSQCQQCPLGATRTNLVFGTGNPNSRLLFIGEGPGADEDEQGLPFVGKAGKLLSQMIYAMGVNRPEIYITNVVKCRPPNNRNPAAEEMAQCRPILQRQIDLINPQLIVTLGNVPTRALIPGVPGITRSRGQLFQFQNRKVLPTFHPAYLLRTPSALAQAWQDFKVIEKLCYENY